MAARNQLLGAPPYPVEGAIKALGANIRTARLRRNITLAEIAEKVGVSRFAVANAEKGKASTSIAVYLALLWALGLLEQMTDVADPSKDSEGLTLSLAHDRTKARRSEVLDNDF